MGIYRKKEKNLAGFAEQKRQTFFFSFLLFLWDNCLFSSLIFTIH